MSGWQGNSGGYYLTGKRARYRLHRRVIRGRTTWLADRSHLGTDWPLWRDLEGYEPPPPEPRASDRLTLIEAKARVEALDAARPAGSRHPDEYGFLALGRCRPGTACPICYPPGSPLERPAPPVRVGDRLRLTGPMRDDPDPVPVGTEGTVNWVGQWLSELTEQIGVAWDNGRRLILLHGVDPYEVTERVPTCPGFKPEGVAE